MDTSQMIDAGSCMTGSGIPVILLQHGLKAPLRGVDGSWLILTDPADVAPTIKRVSRSAPPNLGIMLAPKSDSPVVVVDVDGDNALIQLRELGISSCNSVWIAKTGRGGYHIYFYWEREGLPPSRVIRAQKLPVDLLSNGFAIIPPSDTYREPKGGGHYRWVKGHSPLDISLAELEPLPKSVLDWWQQASNRPDTSIKNYHRGELMPTTKGIGAWQLLTERFPEGSRNHSLTRIAGWLRLYHPPDVVEALLIAINDSRCTPPLQAGEVKAIVQSVFKYPQPGVNGHPKAVVANFYRREMADD